MTVEFFIIACTRSDEAFSDCNEILIAIMETIKSIEVDNMNACEDLGESVIEILQQENKELRARVARCELFMQTTEEKWWCEVQA